MVIRRNDWNTAFQDILNEDPIENSKYLTARISQKEDTALHVAIATQSFKFAEELIKYMKREYLAIKNTDGDTTFSLIATFENVRLAKQMFEKNNELPKIQGANQMLPIQVATQQGHKLMVEFLNKIQGSLEEMDCNKSSDCSKTKEDMKILRRAALINDWNAVYKDVFKEDPLKYSNYLISRTKGEGHTLLHDAAEANSFLFVKELVNYMTEGQLTIENSYGNTAFFVAALYGRVAVALVMFEKNKQLPSIRGNRSMEMLSIHVAAQNGHKEMVEFLYRIQDDPRINEDLEELYIVARRNDWNTAFRNIFKEDPIANSKYLTARISMKEDTALHVAIVTHSFMFAEELIKYMKREDLALKNTDGDTAFSLIAASENVRLAKQMFKKNVKLPNIRRENEMLPIDKATEQGHKLMVEFLRKIERPLEEMDRNKLSGKYDPFLIF
ncbi:hypothetical protein Pint_12272 [Pistacia integerrima]|uniref:Uncharacterized protein n=1 Tax=Pistacia integerrima TaxID=434235 RepID=A0ACC0XHT4_9ROSI|nr:hypothetical protein Pint_12272 [Pistacia integerrima]